MNESPKYDIERLRALLEECKRKFGTKDRFIHPKTITNFLFHFQYLKDKKRKDHVYKNITDYLEVLSNLEVVDIDAKSGAIFFEKFISPIINYYDVYRGFSVYLKWSYFIIVIFLVFSLLFIAKISLSYICLLGLLAVTILFRNRYKEKLHKTYGVFH